MMMTWRFVPAHERLSRNLPTAGTHNRMKLGILACEVAAAQRPVAPPANRRRREKPEDQRHLQTYSLSVYLFVLNIQTI
jgi:hypothetical protein